jgi:hypothetical protein
VECRTASRDWTYGLARSVSAEQVGPCNFGGEIVCFTVFAVFTLPGPGLSAPIPKPNAGWLGLRAIAAHLFLPR